MVYKTSRGLYFREKFLELKEVSGLNWEVRNAEDKIDIGNRVLWTWLSLTVKDRVKALLPGDLCSGQGCKC